jgi:membrane protease YdiL (CAAX protease family)
MEEFIFHGIVFYFVLKKWGVKMACVLSAVVFGMFHWQLNGIWGNLVPMMYIFLLTASAGWSFAYAFTKANSILFPIGLHLGWNIVNIIVFSEGPLGKQWLITNNGIEVGWVISLLLFIYQLIIFPLLVITLSKSKRLMPS